MPGLEVARAEARPRETVTAFLRRTGWATRDRTYGWQFRKGLPTILEINGEAVLRGDWRRRRIGARADVRFVSYPLGGGGNGGAKQILGLVSLIAVSAFAFWAGPIVAGALGFAGSALVGGIATAAIGLGGSLLVNALIMPKPGATNAPGSTQDQIYSVLAQGNAAKLGQPLPVWYGRLKTFPEFAATPWAEFVGNDQWLNVLLSVSMGSMAYEALYVDDTVLWDPVNGISSTFTGAQVAFYEPGQTVTLFPVNVDASPEVNGQQLPDGDGSTNFPGGATPGPPLGPFVANPPATLAQSIAIDFVFPAGCFSVNPDDQQLIARVAFVRLIAEYAPVNDAGAITGAFIPLFDVTRAYASKSPIRDSIKVDVPFGRYTVRFRRGDAALQPPSGTSACSWVGLRSFLKGNNSFPDVSTVAIRLLASQSTQGSHKFGVLGTRKLPVWNGEAFVTQATRNPGWAFLDAVVSEQYGSGLPISKVDFNSIVTFAAGCDSRGDAFDYRVDTAIAVPDALDKILAPARSKHFWLGDTVSIVRDEWRDVPTMLLTDREIVRDSTQVTWTMLGAEDPDAVIVEYLDQDTWLPAQVQYPPNSDTFLAVNAETKRIDGIVVRSNALKIAAYLYLQSIYRRENVQIGCEYEGRAITLGSVIRLQSELPMAYGYGGAVVGVSGNTLTLDPAPVWDQAPFFIRLRMPNGKYFGPISVSEGASPSLAVLDAASLAAAEAAQKTALAAVLAREDGGEYPSFELGTGVSQSRLCLVLNGAPNGDRFTLQLVVDDERVHATDLGDPPQLPTPNFPFNPKVPLVAGLNAQFAQGVAEPMLSASWFPAAGAVYYIAEVSFDGGTSWQQVYQGLGNQFSAVVTLAALTLRVQAVNGTIRGPYSFVSIPPPTIVISDKTVALQSLIDGLQYQVTTLQDQVKQSTDQVTQLLAALDANQAARTWLDKKQLRSELFAQAGDAKASIAELRSVMADDEAAFAEFQTTVSATFGPDFSSVETVSEAFAGVNGVLAASWGVTVNVDGAISGIKLLSEGQGTSVINLLADHVQVSIPGVNPISVFTTGVIAGQPTVGINGNLILSGTITAPMMNVGSLAAITVNAGDIKAGTLSDPNSAKMMIDLNQGFIDIFDNSGSSFAAFDADDDYDEIDLSDPS
jgi:hypothetical protein